MSGTRALFASIGASVSLVAAAALSLLAVSAVFAFGGWSDPVAQSASQTALILADGRDGPSRVAERKAYVLPRRAPAARLAPDRPPGRPAAAHGLRRRAGRHHAVGQEPTAQGLPLPAARQRAGDADRHPAGARAPKKSAGDGVRTAGEDLSGKVQNTGDALAQITDPLLPPVTAATQKVLNVVAELLRRTTNGLGSTVDGLLAPRCSRAGLMANASASGRSSSARMRARNCAASAPYRMR